MMADARRVVVTGIGALSPLGLNARDSWDASLRGVSGVAHTTLFDTTDCPVLFSAEVKGFDPTRSLPKTLHPSDTQPVTQAFTAKEVRRFGRYAHLGVAAGLEAYADAGFDGSLNPERFGINIGVGMGGLGEIEAVHTDLCERGYRRVTPFFITQVITNMASGQLSILLNIKGPNLCNVTACASSAHSLGESMRLIQRGEADIMMAGGAEATICKLGIAGFAAMKALSVRNDAPEKASRPFDRDRDGFVMGEGAAVLVLESLEHAQKRGARIYGELVGYASTGDAYHFTAPAPEGAGGRRAMSLALQGAHLEPSDVDYINVHGTSTPAGDKEEACAIAHLFPDASRHLHISSTKSMTGHLLGASGALEAIFSLLTLTNNKIPPTINLENLDPACANLGLNFIRNHAFEKDVSVSMTNSFGFGGTNATLIFRRFKA